MSYVILGQDREVFLKQKEAQAGVPKILLKKAHCGNGRERFVTKWVLGRLGKRKYVFGYVMLGQEREFFFFNAERGPAKGTKISIDKKKSPLRLKFD